LDPGEEVLDDPAPLVAAQPSAVLRPQVSIASMRRDHVGALLAKLRIEWVAVVRLVAEQILRLRFDHVEVERQLHQRHFVVVRRVCCHGEGHAVAIDDRHDLQYLRLDLTSSCRMRRGSQTTSEQKITRNKVGLLKLAQTLGSVSEARKMMGFSRDRFYRFKELHD
jgi:hypothetical protein